MPIDGPTVWTINHVLEPLYSQLADFNLPGKPLQIPAHPNGVLVAARVYLTIADLLASKKLIGLGSPSAKYPCTYCLIEKDDLENLDYQSFHLRSGPTVRAQAEAYHNALLVKDKKELFAINSV